MSTQRKIFSPVDWARAADVPPPEVAITEQGRSEQPGETQPVPVQSRIESGERFWEKEDPRVQKQINLRVPLPLYLKFKFVASKTLGASMSSLLVDAMERECERFFEEQRRKGIDF